MDSNKHSVSAGRLEIVELGRRRRWSEDEKLRVVRESLAAPRMVSATARRHGISRFQLLAWVRYDAGKKVKERKRQALVDTDGRALVPNPQPADVQDRDGVVSVLKQSRRSYPFIVKASADAGYAGDRPASATLIAVEIVRKLPGQVGFVVHPRRWVAERFFAWISRNRRLWKDPEATIASAEAFLYAAYIMMLLRSIDCAA